MLSSGSVLATIVVMGRPQESAQCFTYFTIQDKS